MKTTWDIFCSVVDNYGDIGVTWRLARQLVVEHGQAVRLWVDDLRAFVRLCPEADALADSQWQQGVEVRVWHPDWQVVEPGQVVIEAFACHLPPAYIEAMAARPRTLWLNLEYLSAEDWVGGCHGLPSPQANGLRKFFFFPGFTHDTGGLLREVDLLARRRVFQADPEARKVFLASIGVAVAPESRLISLFAYENPAVASWLDALAASDAAIQLLVPQGRVVADVQAWLGEGDLVVGGNWRRGNLQVHLLPFMRQEDYDLLLWSCDANIVRGEDSFVRAQWAGRPLLWHIYEQDEQAHWDKLEAFLSLYRQELSVTADAALSGLWQAWNAGEDMTKSWNACLKVWPELAEHAERWCLQQASRPDLTAALVQFYRNWLSCAA
ncbi:elongation factor P maturation arginine rhamnosyltransferase EarP [Pseudomonas sp. LS44]|uniref:elongation factor P maturation arginine rhamnosyltransferase EarP n=1 Tax=Pseudomonas sp. LS44 TaxID=1357074 RepID=UPI00215A4D56|nr:elongation factor P maturation arginine rhamnosyltransferase EarP [Pseudomonas sp. LS44]UVE16216.1 elongation factor P maturation arginine rhamnosyltransferase EarP [Pseudomonas sp. LS44]